MWLWIALAVIGGMLLGAFLLHLAIMQVFKNIW